MTLETNCKLASHTEKAKLKFDIIEARYSIIDLNRVITM
jgi:hypothetical protein